MMPLEQLDAGVYAWLQLPGSVGRANAGVVVDEDGLTVVDTLMVPSQWRGFGDAVAQLGRPVHRVVLTSGHIDFAGGTSQFRLAAVYGSSVTSLQLDEPPNVQAYRRFMPEYAAEFEDLETQHEIQREDARERLTAALEVIPIAGYTPANLIVLVPAAGVLFAGGMCAFGVTPLAFQGDPAGWADALDLVADLGHTIVPGHGPIGSAGDVRALQAYLRACVEAGGDPEAIPPGPWDNWQGRHLDSINVERAALLAQGDDRIPSSFLAAIGAPDAPSS